MKGFKITATLERTLYIDEHSKIEDEVIDPLKALQLADNFLKSKGIKLSKIDMKDWELTNINYTELNDNTSEVQNC